MIYPAMYLDEDNYEEFNKELSEIRSAEINSPIFIGSGEDAPICWEKQNG